MRGRPQKQSLEYFPFDVDMFDDDKVSLISIEFGAVGESILIRLLCKIYRNGYFYQWGEDECLTFCKWSGGIFVPGTVKEVINGCIRRGLFDKSVFDAFKILTSRGIQKRYLLATSERKSISINPDYWLLERPNEARFSFNRQDNTFNRPDNSINHADNSQSKSKVKVKESKVKESAHSQAPVPEVEIVMPWPGEKFSENWNLWKKFKREQFRFSYKKIAEQAALKELAELSAGDEDVAIAIIHQSMSKGWQGLFELKLQTKKNGNHQETTTERPIVAAAREVLRRAAGQDTD